MYSLWIYFVAFFQVVVMNCVKPVNWKYCYQIDKWLIPDLVYAWELKTGKAHPYQSEKDYLNGLQRTSPE
jgi:hypothetical protein